VTEATIDDIAFAKLAKLLATGDVPGIHALYYEWAPCYCRECQRSYCADHWERATEYDDGFYDCVRGTCPEGHTQLLDD
jgi:hypothetical protein